MLESLRFYVGVGDGDLLVERDELSGTAVVLAKLGEGEGVDEAAGRKLGASAMALVREHRVHAGVVVVGLGEVGRVRDDEDVVLGDSEVEFEGLDLEADGVLEGREGVFRARGTASAMCVDLDGLGGERQGCSEQKKR